MATDNAAVLRALVAEGVEFIVIGGVAATIHGLARLTLDIDFVYARNVENLGRLVKALSPFNPYPRGAPPGLPFRWDIETLKRGLNFTLATAIGSLDLLGEAAGDGTYERLLPHVEHRHAYGVECAVVSVRRLIELKRAAGRPKDFEAIAELEALLEEDSDSGTPL
jgi:hypothetical protein